MASFERDGPQERTLQKIKVGPASIGPEIVILEHFLGDGG
jgi:hypothetical protein